MSTAMTEAIRTLSADGTRIRAQPATLAEPGDRVSAPRQRRTPPRGRAARREHGSAESHGGLRSANAQQ
jgi:hypothetical protein